MKQHINSVIFGVAILASSIFVGTAYRSKYETKNKIQVTGLGKVDFSSDLIVWEGRFETENIDLKQAYKILKKHKTTTIKYLESKGIDSTQITLNAVETTKKHKPLYSQAGLFLGNQFTGYKLVQPVRIESKEVDKVEKVSREVTELLNDGVEFYSKPPGYYYTKLSDLKIEMISKATKDAHLRAQKICEFSGGMMGSLISAKMGIFQITGQNSNENYSWGGTFNTVSRKKTASITMKLVYEVE